jgi:hypothetical protein
MKRFHDLTKDQQDTAVSYAISEMKDCVEMGLIKFDKPVSDAVIKDYAICAAEDAWYSQPQDKIVADIADEE